MCGLTSEDAHSSSGETLYQCIYEVFDIMSYTETIMLKKSNIRLEALKRTRTESRSKSQAKNLNPII